MISGSFERAVEDLLRRVDIVDVISEYVQLRRTGRGYVGLCPFHNERSPSFSVSAEKGVYYCFGCGAAGNVIRFVMDLEGLSRLEALGRLAERTGVTLPFAQSVERSADERSHLEQMKAAHELAARVYNHILMNTSAGVQALTYLEGRGISRSTIMAFELGYAPDADDTLVRYLQRKGYSSELLVEAGIAVAYGNRSVDRFRGRVIIPIRDAKGKVVAFGGRTMKADAQPKYLNSPETPLFHKGQMLFNQHQARKEIRLTHTAVLVEGYMDVISAWQAGLYNAVASLGTSLTLEQATTIKRFAQRLIIVYDGDDAGVKAAKRAVGIAEEAGLSVQIVQLPERLDPDEYIRLYGSEAFLHQLSAKPVSVVRFFLQDLEHRANLQSVAGRNEFLRAGLEILAERATPIEQETELKKLSQTFQLSMEALKDELALLAKSVNKQKPNRRVQTIEVAPVAKELLRSDVQAGNRLLQAMLTDPESFAYVLDRGVDELALPEQTALLALLYGFKASNPDADVTTFLDSLDDPQLVRLASSLLVQDELEFSSNVLDDYLRTIEFHRKKARYQEVLAQLTEAQVLGDASAVETWRALAEQLQQDIMLLNHRP